MAQALSVLVNIVKAMKDGEPTSSAELHKTSLKKLKIHYIQSGMSDLKRSGLVKRVGPDPSNPRRFLFQLTDKGISSIKNNTLSDILREKRTKKVSKKRTKGKPSIRREPEPLSIEQLRTAFGALYTQIDRVLSLYQEQQQRIAEIANLTSARGGK